MTAPESPEANESDVAADDAQASSRAEGGDPDADGGDSESTTGTGVSEGFVGAVSGQDEGYADETGAERRAAAEGS
jgi:hypothetical protein